MGNDPEQFVEQIERWPWMSTFQNRELLAEARDSLAQASLGCEKGEGLLRTRTKTGCP
jgi:hypothetical protein